MGEIVFFIHFGIFFFFAKVFIKVQALHFEGFMILRLQFSSFPESFEVYDSSQSYSAFFKFFEHQIVSSRLISHISFAVQPKQVEFGFVFEHKKSTKALIVWFNQL